MGYIGYRNWILRKLCNVHNGIPQLDTPPINVSHGGVHVSNDGFHVSNGGTIQWLITMYPMTAQSFTDVTPGPVAVRLFVLLHDVLSLLPP